MRSFCGAGRPFETWDGCVRRVLGLATITAAVLAASASPSSALTIPVAHAKDPTTSSGRQAIAEVDLAPQLVAPVLGKVEQSATRWREGPNMPQFSSRHRRDHKPPVGTTFTFTLSEEAFVTFDFIQRNAGRIVGHQCVHQTPRNSVGHKACRHLTQGIGLGSEGKPGMNTLRFDGNYGTHPNLVPGPYTLTVYASVSQPQVSPTERPVVLKSATRTLHFTIVK